MGLKMWITRYDEAAKAYAQACKLPKGSTKRHNMRYWKKCLTWCDGELAKNGETYIEKEAS